MSDKIFNMSVEGRTFLVTGGAGFIGSNLAEYLLRHKAAKVRVLDDLSTGSRRNIDGFERHDAFEFMQGDITRFEDCEKATRDIEFVLHQAALGSVPRSIKNPVATNNTNVGGFVNILFAAHTNHVKRVVYASSSSVYGDDTAIPKKENNTGNPLSPYAVSKKTNELYADIFYKTYGLEIIGLRYFNVFGPKQNIEGPYAAVIPIFISKLLAGSQPEIYGDGTISRDFTYIDNVVQANIVAVMSANTDAINQVYNIAYGSSTSLNDLYAMIAEELGSALAPHYLEPRKGDIQHSLADIGKAKQLLGYTPGIDISEGLQKTVEWYKSNIF
jgi:UDP-N-acetylglucosamine/UDP-N-acetylgalactosamine 4-epimerase